MKDQEKKRGGGGEGCETNSAHNLGKTGPQPSETFTKQIVQNFSFFSFPFTCPCPFLLNRTVSLSFLLVVCPSSSKLFF